MVELKDDTITEYTISPRILELLKRHLKNFKNFRPTQCQKAPSLGKEGLSQPDSLAANIVALNAGGRDLCVGGNGGSQIRGFGSSNYKR
ncbi:MAG: hypothetical protein Ct9H90mP27_2670 [Gammaproteobacteria bacterium]|nr:MAG: hypothetical protein Ct9H90mP27_2670 [Gammaproteobacteria bacterium]